MHNTISCKPFNTAAFFPAAQEREAERRHYMSMHVTAMQAQNQANLTQTAITANTAMSTASHGYGPAEVVETESYCGPISWIIGLFLLPCICFCPVDQRPVSAAKRCLAMI
jgi:hypothetical protein